MVLKRAIPLGEGCKMKLLRLFHSALSLELHHLREKTHTLLTCVTDKYLLCVTVY